MRDLLRQQNMCPGLFKAKGMFWYLDEFANFTLGKHHFGRGALGSQAAWGVCGRMLSDCQGRTISERASNEPKRKEIDQCTAKQRLEDLAVFRVWRPSRSCTVQASLTVVTLVSCHLPPWFPCFPHWIILVWLCWERCEVLHGLRMRYMIRMALNDGTNKMWSAIWYCPPELPHCCLKTVHQCHCLLSLYRWGQSITAEL